MKYITIIPARGGSKRFPGKNTHALNGIPLICHSIEYSLNNATVLGTYVSTDSDEIKCVSEKAGAEVIDRPAEFAGDFATTASAMKHAVKYLIDKGVEFDYVVLLQATNPLRPIGLLDEAISILEKGNNDSLFTVNRNEKKLGKIIDGKFVPWNYKFGQRSQDLDPLYYENGLLYITKKELLLQEIIEGPTAYPLVVNHPFGEVDIDTVEDFHYAEYMLNSHTNY
ncbi:cytidylyltransferase domain-containing protein [Prevotella communis]|uniref:acylneuraminate cytidylyltransferase family protein n=1 Tax=Prevotella communis TaxID=2913614 RepID=UPI001EDAFB4C|nr:acylneuraminate cytidylyltransferase family protein [Prevotella communis]UKK56823.1 acylneuraminate cytidylyltransferase family protein [Prevotella communis]